MDIQDEIIKNAPFGVMVFEPNLPKPGDAYEFKLVSSNDLAEKYFGLPGRVKENKFLQVVFPDEAAAHIYDACTETLKTSRKSELSISIKLNSVSEYFNVIVQNCKNKIALFVQKQSPESDAALPQTENEIKYRVLFETSLDAIFLAVDNFKITGFNPKFCEIFKYAERNFSTLFVRDLFKNPDAYDKFTDRLNQKKFVEEFETELLTSDGNVCYCMINAVAVSDENNKLIMYQGVVRDMTRRHQAEQQLITAEKLVLTGKLAATIAHEVRNPLTNIRLALDQFKEEVTEEITDADFFLDLISRNTDRISNLITDLMNSSKQRSMELNHYRINDIMEETITLIQDRLRLKEIKYETNFSDDLPFLLMDKNQIKIAFINILLNAVEAMIPGKGLLQIITHSHGSYIYVEVTDNGKGIPEDEIINIFEPFYTRRKDGSGLGLTATRNIIHAHKGSIKATSKLGEGTTFQMVFSPEVKADQIKSNAII